MVLDYTRVVHYYTIVGLCTIVNYTVVVLQTIVHYCTVDTTHCYTMAYVHYYTMDTTQVVMLHVQLAPCIYLQSFISSSPRFYSPCLRVQLTYKSYKMYSSVFSGNSTSGGNDKDHAHVFYKYHTMVLLKIKGFSYPLQYIMQIMDIHSFDGLLSFTLYTRHLLLSPFLYYDSTIMLSSSNIV